MDEPRWSNVQRARGAYNSGAIDLEAGPLEAFFEVAAACNLHCQMCAINYDSRYLPRSGRPKVFSPDLFSRLEPIFPTLVRAYLFGLGEPLLNPHLVDYVRRLSDAGAEVWFNTNATLIDEEKADRLARAGAGRISVSIDGATAETYERIRVGASFSAVTRGIRALVAAQRKHGRPIVSLSFVAMASNIAELPRLVDLCADVGAEGVHVEPLLGQQQADLEDHYQRENLGVLEAGLVSRALEESLGRARERKVQITSRFFETPGDFDYLHRTPSLRIDWRCSEPWSSIWVTAAGEVRTCCMNETSFGNLFERDFSAIWNGAAFKEFRREHAAREMARGCGNCVRNGRVRQSAFFAPVRAVTYRPIERREVSGPAPLEIHTPTPGATITDPLVVGGRMVSKADASRWEVMLDDTLLGIVRIDERLRPGGEFVLSGPVPFVSEGTHLLWMRRPGDSSGPGYGYREVHLWRPDVAPGSMRAASACWISAGARRRVRRAEALVGGKIWRRTTFLRPDEPTDRVRVAVLDLAGLAPGPHDVEIRLNGRRAAVTRIERLAAP